MLRLRSSLAFALAAFSVCSGCGSLRPANAPPNDLCESYSSKHITAGTIAAAGGVGAGLGGFSTGAFTTEEQQKTRMILGITTLVVGAVTAGAVYYSNSYAARYAERCGNGNKP